jgi:hypothetical protein
MCGHLRLTVGIIPLSGVQRYTILHPPGKTRLAVPVGSRSGSQRPHKEPAQGSQADHSMQLQHTERRHAGRKEQRLAAASHHYTRLGACPASSRS